VLTAAFWNANVRDNLDELYSSQKLIGTRTEGGNYTVNQTLIASASDVFSSDITWTANGTSAYRIEFYCGAMANAAGGFTQVILVDGSGTKIQQIAQCTASVAIRCPCFVSVYYTPSAGSASVNIRGIYATAGNGTLFSSAADFQIMRLSVFGPDIT